MDTLLTDPIDAALSEVERALKAVRAKRSAQLRSADEKDYLKSVVYAWSQHHRPLLLARATAVDVQALDGAYGRVLAATAKDAARATYVRELKKAKAELVALRSGTLLRPPASTVAPTGDAPPDFSPLATDAPMQEILIRRWSECQLCLAAEAHLAATVMMGGLLEALFVARANRLNDKSALFKAKSTPRDGQTQKPIPLKEWTLRP